jgi:hypothetical protein
LGLYYLFWREAKKLVRETRDRPELAWANHFGRMLQVVLVAFAVGGAFLSLILYDVPYYLMMVLLIVRRLAAEELRRIGPSTSAPPWERYSQGHATTPARAT